MRCVLFAAAFFALVFSGVCACGPDESSDDEANDDFVPADDTTDDDLSDDTTDDDLSDDDADDDSVDDDLDDDVVDDDTDDDADDDTGPHDYVGAVVGYVHEDNHFTPIIWRDDHGTWTREELPASTDHRWLFDVFMIDAENGWAAGSAQPDAGIGRGVIYRRTAAGWTEASLDIYYGCGDISDLDFLSTDEGWAMCGVGITTQAYRYQAGSWTAVDFPIAAADSMPFCAMAFDLTETDHAYVAGLFQGMGGIAQYFEWDGGVVVDSQSGSWFDWYDGVAVEDGEGWYAHCTWRASFYPPNFYHLSGGQWTDRGDLGDYYGCVSKFARSPSGNWYAAAYGGGPAVFRYEGGDWVLVPGRSPRAFGGGFSAMDVKADDFAVAAGTSYDEYTGTGPGLVMTYRGSIWRDVTEPSAVMNASYQGVSYVYDPW